MGRQGENSNTTNAPCPIPNTSAPFDSLRLRSGQVAQYKCPIFQKVVVDLNAIELIAHKHKPPEKVGLRATLCQLAVIQ